MSNVFIFCTSLIKIARTEITLIPLDQFVKNSIIIDLALYLTCRTSHRVLQAGILLPYMCA